MDIGTAMRVSRLVRRAPQWKAARELGCSVRALQDYEAGRRAVPPEIIEAAVRVYGPNPWLREAVAEHPVARAYRALLQAA
ncbi:MAG: helix-turn-helix transcriptional regulator [Clostridia bacterium]|nr:helix-turn-helix transcriptional regulator [Clostridia bacterium]